MPRKAGRESRADPKSQFPWKLALLLAVLTLAVYANTFSLGFALDSIGVVQGDPRVHAVTTENLANIFRYDYWWPSSVDTLYRPLTTLSFLFNYSILGNGDNPAGYHVANVIVHIANVLGLFLLALRLIRNQMVAFYAAALWAVHPVLTESVANIAGRADLLAAMAVLSGLLVYDRVLASEQWWGLVAGLFGIALFGVFSKESAAVLVGLMLLWDLVCGPGWRGGGARRAASYGAVLCALAITVTVRYAVFAAAPAPEMPFVDNPLRGAGFLAARWTAIKMIGMDLALLVWPLRLSCERGFAQIAPATAGDPGAWLALAVSVGILTAVVVRYRRDKVLFFAAGMFAIALLPVSNLVLLIGATMAERFLYLPSVGFAVAAAVLLYRAQHRAPVKTIGMVLIGLLALRTFARNRDWHSNLTLAHADVQSAPHSARLHEMLASSLFAQDPVRNLDAAMAHGEAAWEILRGLQPGEIYQQTPARLGAYYRMKGDAIGAPASREWYEKSAAILERARESSQAIEKAYDQAQVAHGKPLATRVAYQPIYADLGIAYLRLGRYQEAIDALRYGREIDPRTPLIYDLLAAAYFGKGEVRGLAVTVLGKILLLGPSRESFGEVEKIYGSASCAIQKESGTWKLNEACPETQGDLCSAELDLADLLMRARLSSAAAYFSERAGKLGCIFGK